jgi:DNA repair exonuclease SbcCD ATPase subunit
VAQDRSERESQNAPGLPVVAEVLRQSAEPKDDCTEDGKDESKLPTFWKVFGSTVLSISAMVVVTAYQSLSSNAAEVRADVAALSNEMHKELARLAESKGELVKKDECDSRLKSVWSDVRELQEDQKELQTLRERCAALVKLQQQSEQERRRLADEVQALREQQAMQQQRRALAAEVSALRERLAGLEGRPAVSTRGE